MNISIRLFAKAKDLAGTDHATLQLPTGATLGHARALLVETYPALAPLASRLLAAVNTDYAADAHELCDGAEVAFFPPVSGG